MYINCVLLSNFFNSLVCDISFGSLSLVSLYTYLYTKMFCFTNNNYLMELPINSQQKLCRVNMCPKGTC